MPRLPSLSIFMPCYNEEGNIERVARMALEAGSKYADKFEVILVNDGSKDRTGEIADRLAAQHPEIRAAHNRPNRGYGGAVQRGFEEARMEWVFFTDGDGQFDIMQMDRLIALLDKCDVAVGYRINRADPLIRKLNAWCWGMLVRSLFSLKVRDIDCAFKLIPRSALEGMNLHSEGALISTELLAKCKYRGLRIAEVGVNHYPRKAGQQTGANFKVILRAFYELFKLRRHIRSEGLPAREGIASRRDAGM